MTCTDSEMEEYTSDTEFTQGQRITFSPMEPQTSVNSRVTELESENKDLKEQVETLTFHIGAYRRALEKCPQGLEKYKEGFREFRDHVLCPQCEKDRLLMKIKDLEDRIMELDGFHSPSVFTQQQVGSPILGGTGGKKFARKMKGRSDAQSKASK